MVAHNKLHPWVTDLEQAIEIQTSLRDRLRLAWDGRPVRRVGGVDVAYRQGQAHAVIAVLDYGRFTLVEVAEASIEVSYPYIPGLLVFREGPAVLAAWEKLGQAPDVLFFDGQGIAHPRHFGLAAHLGLWLGLPSIGVAKSHYYGNHSPGPGPLPGDFVPLLDVTDSQQVIGAVLRTRANCRPLYVSPGHLMDIDHAVRFVLLCCRGHRLPEPSRLAHQLANSRRSG